MNSPLLIWMLIGLLPAACRATSRPSVFFLGDSTHIFLYKVLKLQCFGSQPDPAATGVPWEHIGDRHEAALKCTANHSKLERIGLMNHWGVGSPPYHHAWAFHRATNDTNSSKVNINNAFDEFQRRSAGSDGKVLFVFLSNFWDFRGHIDHTLATKPFPNFLDEYRRNSTDVVSQLVRRLRRNDELVLQTSHMPTAEYTSYAFAVNKEVRKVADKLKLRVLDTERVAGMTDCAAAYLHDFLHQNDAASLRIIDEIYKLLTPPPLFTREECAAALAAPASAATVGNATGGRRRLATSISRR